MLGLSMDLWNVYGFANEWEPEGKSWRTSLPEKEREREKVVDGCENRKTERNFMASKFC